MSPPAIQADHLSRSFGDRTVVREVSFDIPRGSVFGLLGPNGSGKSTIIRMLCGVLRPSGGTGSVLGIDVRADPEGIKRRIGYMSQKFSLYADLSCIENIHFYTRVYGLPPARRRERTDAVVGLTGIRPYIGMLAGNLSGGWKQRLALACALVHEPEVLFLDEPTAGIDPVARRELWDLLFELRGRGVTMFVTTHYMDEAERCTMVGYIYLSRLIALGTAEELKRLPDVTPPGSGRLEVACADATQAMARARGTPGVKDATLFGDRLHLLVSDELAADDLLRRIAPQDPQAWCRPVAPTLEDVFVLLTRVHAGSSPT